MPRTKVSKNSKRNRDAAIREEKIREFDAQLEQMISSIDMKVKQNISDIETDIVLIKTRIPERVLSMKISDLMNMNLQNFSDVEQLRSYVPLEPMSSQNFKKSKDDEGYSTEDSRGSSINVCKGNLAQLRMFTRSSRLPGPLSSAKARKPRRSRSASDFPSSALKPKPSASYGHLSRQKVRTPMMSRKKAISADRTFEQNGTAKSPSALLRWPKPGEMVISVTGSPVVAQVMPDHFANVNIPIRDGVLSLRPKKLQNLDPTLVHRIDANTLSQIKLLQSNLDLIISFADRSEKSS